MEQYEFYMPTHLYFGVGSLGKLAEAIGVEGWQRVLIVTGPRVSRTDCFKETVKALENAGVAYEIFDRVEPDPSAETVERGGAMAAAMKAQCVLGYGGGSNLDAAKAVAVIATNGGRARDHFGKPRYGKLPLPIAAVPTTAGTASEVTYFSVVTDTAKREKFPLASSQIAPRMAALDARVLASAPKPVLAAAGMDALTHAVESYLSRNATPVTGALALEGVRLVGANLKRLCDDPSDLEAGAAMLLGSNMAGWAFNHSQLGVAHALALPPGARFGVPHGVANAILLPVAMAYNRSACAEAMAAVGRALGVPSHLGVEEQAAAAVEVVRALGRAVGLPAGLGEVGVSSEAFEAMIEDASRSRHIAANPRTVAPGDLLALYKQAF